jgi:hypothetical protein
MGTQSDDRDSGLDADENLDPGQRKPTPYPRGEPESSPAARPRRKGRARRAIARSVVAMLSAAALVATGYAYATLDRVQDNVRTTDALIQQDDEGVAPPQDDGATDILLVGTDSRTDMQGNPLPLEVLKELRTVRSGQG